MKILIKGGRVIDPSQGIDKTADVLVENGKIAKIGSNIKVKADKTIDAGGKIVAPGFVDMHTHLREPGREDVETIESGMKAALMGGFTTISAMPNTSPSCDTQSQAKFIIEKARLTGLCNVLPIGAITKGREGKEMTEMSELKAAGCPAVSDDGSSVENSDLMRHALEYSVMSDMLVISHCEDKALSGDGVMHEGFMSTVLGLNPIPSASESVMVERDIQLAALTGARLHIAHVSAAESVEIIRAAKKNGVRVTAEVTPHHLSLTDEELKSYDTNLKVNPPLRSALDVKALKKGVKDGTIDAIATDHAPHPVNEKEKEFDYAPFGMIGLETALSVSAMSLIDEGYLDWPGLIKKMSTAPAEILKCGRGTLKEGAPADIVVIEPEKEWVYEQDKIKSRSTNSPFIGKKLKVKVTDVISGGKIVVLEGELT